MSKWKFGFSSPKIHEGFFVSKSQEYIYTSVSMYCNVTPLSVGLQNLRHIRSIYEVPLVSSRNHLNLGFLFVVNLPRLE